jgi:hypothetical protein
MNASAELLLYVLCVCVRLLSREQAMRLSGIRDRANYRRLIRGLRAAGLLDEVTVWAKPVPLMQEPIFAYDPATDSRNPDLAKVLSRARLRWAGSSAAPVPCIIAGKRAERLYGVERSRSLSKPLQCSHDLALSECLNAKREAGRIEVEDWQGEDFTCFRLGDIKPDAVLVGDAEHEPRAVIEVVGADYREHRLIAIHRDCVRNGIPLEYW